MDKQEQRQAQRRREGVVWDQARQSGKAAREAAQAEGQGQKAAKGAEAKEEGRGSRRGLSL